MRPYSSALALAAFLAFPAVAGAQSASSTGSVSLDALKDVLKEELRQELKDELKAEIKAEMAEEAATAGPVAEDGAWAEEEWKWEEPAKPELNFLEFDGYFRFRYDFFNNLDLGTYYKNTATGVESGPFAPGFAPPVPLCNTDVGTRAVGSPGDSDYQPGSTSCANTAGTGKSLGGANMRLRIEPVFNVYEDVKIKMQIDVLDNMVLGSTPDGFPTNPISPILAFSQSQLTPTAGVNTIWEDSIRVKRAWAEVMTPLGQLRVGRMPSDFGMGLLANQGAGIDSDFGDSNDRIMFATKIGDFYIVPAYDWVLSGPTSAQSLMPYGQAFDRDQRDDVDQYILAIAKRDKPEDVEQKLANDEIVLNFGTYQVGRFQALDAATFYSSGNPDDQATTKELVERDAQAYIYSWWVKFMWRKLTVEAEYAGIIGRIGNSVISGPYGSSDKALTLNQHAASIDIKYKLFKDAMTLQLLVVAASGDSAPGWGIRPLSSTAAIPGAWDGTQAPEGDTTINNFRIDPNFVVDLIFWRQLVGMITDAVVIRPSLQYNLTEGFGARLDLVYSHALHASSTPSGSFSVLTDDAGQDISLGKASGNLGLEADVKLFYDSDDGFHAWLQYGLFVPFAGLDREVVVESTSPLAEAFNASREPIAKLDAGVAHTLQLLLGVSF